MVYPNNNIRKTIEPIHKIDTSKKVLNIITFPINNTRKKIALLVVLFFAFLAQSDLSNLLFEIPDFNNLTISQGKIKIHKGQGKIRDAFTLVLNNQEILFSCGVNECLPINKTPDYQGKTAKVWWYKSKNIGLMGGENRLYQLEINEQMVISYQDQTKRYLFTKNYCLCINLMLFVISVVFFLVLQFANDPMLPKK
jgi:hypothetical protein